MKGVSEPDAGSGTVLMAGVVSILLLGCLVMAALVQAASARHRAESAADLAALAGVQSVLDGSAGDPCGMADRIASENGAQLSSCRAAHEEVWVTTAVPVPGLLTRLGPATAHAHAGPGRQGPNGH